MFNSGKRIARQVLYLWLNQYMPVDQIAASLQLDPYLVYHVIETWIEGNPPPAMMAVTR